MNNEHSPIPAKDFTESFATIKPRFRDDSLAVGAGVTAIIVLGLTILGLVVILWF